MINTTKYRVSQKLEYSQQFLNHVYDDREKHSTHQNVHLFICSHNVWATLIFSAQIQWIQYYTNKSSAIAKCDIKKPETSSIIWCKVYFDVLNHLHMTHKCDKQDRPTVERTDFISKCHASLWCMYKHVYITWPLTCDPKYQFITYLLLCTITECHALITQYFEYSLVSLNLCTE